ncbi:MAG: adenylate/guanylate cyclase domain-containing protein [Elusimicrobia bacterium]|nr:adenylate/guanylate cyclase domain-containing protein [Elusimicrobiota bacterium]
MNPTKSDFGIPDGQYGQIFCMRIDMLNSEHTLRNTSPAAMRSLQSKYAKIVNEEVVARSGILGSWQGDGAMAFLGTQGDEDHLIQSGEEMSRMILNRLRKEIPDKHFRIGAASSPVRFFSQHVDQFSNPGAVLAARLEEEARNHSTGSALLLPGDVYSALAKEARDQYRHVGRLLETQEIYLYIPDRDGSFVSPLSPTPGGTILKRLVESVNPPLTERPRRTFFTQFDPVWPFAEESGMHVAFVAHPMPLGDLFRLREHKSWIMENFLTLPIGSKVFKDEDFRCKRLTLFVAEKRESQKVQFLKFYSHGGFAFADASWRNMPDWQGAFYPEATRRPLLQAMDFAKRYFDECLRVAEPVDINVMLWVVNVAGYKRKLAPGRTLPPSPFVYDKDICATVRTDPKNLVSENAVSTLYDQIIEQSNLDVKKWGWKAHTRL